MTSLQITLGGVEIMNRQLTRWIGNMQDLRPALLDVAKLLTESNRENFDREGRFGELGRPWKPLSPAYRAWKDVHFPGQPILVRTGALRDSLTRMPMGVQHTTNTSLVVGTDVPYAVFHQSGGKNLPARPPVQLTEQTRREMLKILQRHIVSGTRA